MKEIASTNRQRQKDTVIMCLTDHAATKVAKIANVLDLFISSKAVLMKPVKKYINFAEGKPELHILAEGV